MATRRARFVLLMAMLGAAQARILKERDWTEELSLLDAREMREELEETEEELRIMLANLWFKPSPGAAPAPQPYDAREFPRREPNPICREDRNCGNAPQRAFIIQVNSNSPEEGTQEDPIQLTEEDFETPGGWKFIIERETGG